MRNEGIDRFCNVLVGRAQELLHLHSPRERPESVATYIARERVAGWADLERVAVVSALGIIGDGFVPGKLVKDVGGRDDVPLCGDLVRKAQDGAGDLQGKQARSR